MCLVTSRGPWMVVALQENMFENLMRLCLFSAMVVIGLVSTLAGSGLYSYADGVGSAASFKSPGGVTVSANGVVFVADSENSRIRMITTSGFSCFILKFLACNKCVCLCFRFCKHVSRIR